MVTQLGASHSLSPLIRLRRKPGNIPGTINHGHCPPWRNPGTFATTEAGPRGGGAARDLLPGGCAEPGPPPPRDGCWSRLASALSAEPFPLSTGVGNTTASAGSPSSGEPRWTHRGCRWPHGPGQHHTHVRCPQTQPQRAYPSRGIETCLGRDRRARAAICPCLSGSPLTGTASRASPAQPASATTRLSRTESQSDGRGSRRARPLGTPSSLVTAGPGGPWVRLFPDGGREPRLRFQTFRTGSREVPVKDTLAPRTRRRGWVRDEAGGGSGWAGLCPWSQS